MAGFSYHPDLVVFEPVIPGTLRLFRLTTANWVRCPQNSQNSVPSIPRNSIRHQTGARNAPQLIDKNGFTRRRKQRIIWKQNPRAGLPVNRLNGSWIA